MQSIVNGICTASSSSPSQRRAVLFPRRIASGFRRVICKRPSVSSSFSSVMAEANVLRPKIAMAKKFTITTKMSTCCPGAVRCVKLRSLPAMNSRSSSASEPRASGVNFARDCSRSDRTKSAKMGRRRVSMGLGKNVQRPTRNVQRPSRKAVSVPHLWTLGLGRWALDVACFHARTPGSVRSMKAWFRCFTSSWKAVMLAPEASAAWRIAFGESAAGSNSMV